MVGYIAGLTGSVRRGLLGEPLVGARLYVYDSGSAIPVLTYSDYKQLTKLPHPMIADASGQLPFFWVPDGTYRVVLTDAAGVTIIEDEGFVALGATAGVQAADEGFDSTGLYQTGDVIWQGISGARSGWVRCNALTIGSAVSGATERANSDCEDLFLYLYATYSNTLCPVSGGRGASADADWSANKTIGTLDLRSKIAYGLDDMGNSAAGAALPSTSAAEAVGASTYTILTANLPSTTLSFTLGVGTTVSVVGSTASRATVYTDLGTDTDTTGFNGDGGSGAITSASVNDSKGTLVLQSSAVSGTIDLGGSGTHLNPVMPARTGSYYMKL